MDWFLKEFDELNLDELYEILKLRAEVFVVEQDCAYNDLDDKDQMAMHLFLKDGGEIIAVSRILPENVAFEDMAIGRVIVKKEYRGRGIATEIMKKAIDYIVNDLKKDKIRLSGQAYLVRFYEDLGFKKVSDVYLEDGIDHFEFLYEV
ncbi:MAG: GNAT family N-acetyltransferase [Methanobrevibacter sp.]|uniref:GNAT family N-acetyltransferase n=1 Tax=Methanobrevibacter sp. TaxID=66852 RepID=UPI002E76D382|nr:GNAT family N-acetyltransferase [Methanobrevibacter sp.]MEE0935162.1 GNAT family N-acetyltransferase [Methanobrevibacter sp.]